MAGRFDAELITAVAETTRLEILRCLSGGKELCAAEIGASFDLSQPTLSHHLNLLVDMGVLDVRKDGRKVFYSINAARISAIAAMLTGLCEKKPAPVKRTAAAKKTTAAKTAAAKPFAAKKTVAAAKPAKDDKKPKKKKGEKDKKKKDKKKKK